MKNRFAKTIATAALSIAAVAVGPTDAEACGGFFCDNQQPINQAAERIIFSDNPDGTVTAVVQILYQGPSESFAWVLPVPSVPEVSVSSNLAFQRLQQQTNPQYTLNTIVEGECAPENERNFANSPNAGGFDAGLEGAADAGSQPPVAVLDQGTVGPYDYTVIEVDGSLPDLVTPATDWLTENGYDITALGPEVIRPYLEEGMKLLAFKLTKNAMSGDIRPVILEYETDTPSIPIKLTAVAANDDMGVLTWVLGESRAVPLTYKSLVLNDALINWFNPASTYDQVISRAADEAQGQGFVTEYAGTAEVALETVFNSGDEQNWELISQTDYSQDPSQLVVEAWSTYAGGFGGIWDGWPETINSFFSGLSQEERDQIIQCAACQPGLIPDTFDTAAFLTELEENVVKPMRDTQDIIDGQTYMTRLYTTLSAAEMTQDPVFDFNSDLPDVSNQHSADRVIECNPDVFQGDAAWRVELPSGLVVRGQGGRTWPLSPSDEIPANAYVLQDSTEGDGEIVEDNVETIRQELESRNASVPEPPRAGEPDSQVPDSGDSDGLTRRPGEADDSSCSVAGASALPMALVVGFFALIGFSRRRRV